MKTVAAGKALTEDQRARNKGDLGFAVSLATQAIDQLFESGGGGGMFSKSTVQRFWRDAHAGAMHISMNRDVLFTLRGRVILGLPPGPVQF
jgi:alkylation response protein AidB-like acyl-CoA dehydrogenase